MDPTGLVNSLRLEKGHQQDAAEWVVIDDAADYRFSKLFMFLVASEFKKQPDPALRTTVTDMVGFRMGLT